MRRGFLAILLLLFFSFAECQLWSVNTDSMKLLLDNTKQDTTQVYLNAGLSLSYAFSQPDSGIKYAQKAISLAREIQYKPGEASAFFSYGWALWSSANYDKAIEASLRSLNLYKALKYDEKLSLSYLQLAVFYRDAGEFTQALRYSMVSANLVDSLNAVHKTPMINPFQTIASIYGFTNQVDSMSLYATKAYEWEKARGGFTSGYTYQILGGVEEMRKNYQKALDYYFSAIHIATIINNNIDIA